MTRARGKTYDIGPGIRKFGEIGEKMRAYLFSWYEAIRHYPGLDTEGMSSLEEVEAIVKSWENKEDAPSTRKSLERDSEEARRPASDEVGKEDIPDGARGDGQGAGNSGKDADEALHGSGHISVSNIRGATGGAQSDSSVPGRSPRNDGSATNSRDTAGSTRPSDQGLLFGQGTSSDANEHAERAISA